MRNPRGAFGLGQLGDTWSRAWRFLNDQEFVHTPGKYRHRERVRPYATHDPRFVIVIAIDSMAGREPRFANALGERSAEERLLGPAVDNRQASGRWKLRKGA